MMEIKYSEDDDKGHAIHDALMLDEEERAG